MEFAGRQAANLASPANYLATNPELLEATRAEAGQNLVRGFSSFVDDLQRLVEDRPPAGTEEYMVGARVAVTPGEVILRNRLIEVIQYSPQTATVQAEPILITPAWIMKYYILDLSPPNSFVRYRSTRATVFLMSRKNPTEADRDLGMDDYVREGFSPRRCGERGHARAQGARARLLHRRYAADDCGGGARAGGRQSDSFDDIARRAGRLLRSPANCRFFISRSSSTGWRR